MCSAIGSITAGESPRVHKLEVTMKLVKSLLLGSAAGFAVIAGANAADLPSKKAAPASYVKICDAYGAGFFYIPGTDTCIRVGGYVRAEYQYTPGHNVYAYSGTATSAVLATPVQVSGAQDTSGMEMRGRIDVDARTATPWGTARTFVRIRLANVSGIRSAVTNNNAVFTNGSGATTSPTLESALIQWAGFAFGVAPENYAFMPSQFYHSNPWTGFPNGMKQLAYTATFGGGLSATVAIEDKTEYSYQTKYNSTPANGYNLTANIRYDQPWGWAIVHGTIGNNSYNSAYTTTGAAPGVLGGLGAGNGWQGLREIRPGALLQGVGSRPAARPPDPSVHSFAQEECVEGLESFWREAQDHSRPVHSNDWSQTLSARSDVLWRSAHQSQRAPQGGRLR